MNYPITEIYIWTQVMLVLSVCVILFSVVNYLLQNDPKQEVETIFIGLGMAVWSLALHIYIKLQGFYIQGLEGDDMTIWLCAVIPIIGGVTGLGVLELVKRLKYKYKTN